MSGLYEKNLNTNEGTSYYFAGSQRVAMRETTSSSDTVYYFVADHPKRSEGGSTSVTLNASGNKIDEMKYYPFGETRSGGTPTDRRFIPLQGTGRPTCRNRPRQPVRLRREILLARAGRFLSADTIVPNPSNPQSLNRFSYVRNNPLKYTDPTGHIEKYDDGGGEPITCQQTNTCVTFGEYFENVILPVAAFFFDGAEYAELFNQCRKGECTAGDVLLTLIPTGIGKVFKGGSKALGLADNLPMGAVDDLPLGAADDVVQNGLRGIDTWGNPKTLAKHFSDHGSDFGAKTAEEYAQQASDFLQVSQANKLPTKIDADGIIRVYDQSTNTFAAYNPNGTTK